ncbi:MAG: tRNA pseudouridine(13) synthase TruD [Candidatus Thermoplasmatota archaeon]|nr:tRNA pseudouridine(13) synthase TruD [Candidatus Thermoplasmatota archaeon]
MKVLEIEKKIGIETFFTSQPGLGGKLRVKPEDFLVKEIPSYPPEKKDGKFTIAEITSTSWETNLLLRELSGRLHISKKRINFAGTKDKRAKTTQIMSFYNIPVEKIKEIKIKDVEIKNIYQSDKPVKIGNLNGNYFEIIIRNINQQIKSEKVTEIFSVIQNNGGFPNFFGIQRFGIIRPITHIVGKYIVQGDFEKAVMTYIANPIKGEDEETFNLRSNLEKTKNFSQALKTYPNHLSFEKAILNKLVVNSNDFVGGLKELPKNLLTMFIYAYQSSLFNRILSIRIKKGFPINKAIEGDVVLAFRNGAFDEELIPVKKNNIGKVNIQISKGKACVSSILFGYNSIFSDGEMGEIEHKVIESEKFDARDFIIPEISFISSSGSRRPIIGFIQDFDFNLIKDDLNPEKKALFLKFQLQKGSYATSLLREFMKADDIRNY